MLCSACRTVSKWQVITKLKRWPVNVARPFGSSSLLCNGSCQTGHQHLLLLRSVNRGQSTALQKITGFFFFFNIYSFFFCPGKGLSPIENGSLKNFICSWCNNALRIKSRINSLLSTHLNYSNIFSSWRLSTIICVLKLMNKPPQQRKAWLDYLVLTELWVTTEEDQRNCICTFIL